MVNHLNLIWNSILVFLVGTYLLKLVVHSRCILLVSIELFDIFEILFHLVNYFSYPIYLPIKFIPWLILYFIVFVFWLAVDHIQLLFKISFLLINEPVKLFHDIVLLLALDNLGHNILLEDHHWLSDYFMVEF